MKTFRLDDSETTGAEPFGALVEMNREILQTKHEQCMLGIDITFSMFYSIVLLPKSSKINFIHIFIYYSLYYLSHNLFHDIFYREQIKTTLFKPSIQNSEEKLSFNRKNSLTEPDSW